MKKHIPGKLFYANACLLSLALSLGACTTLQEKSALSEQAEHLAKSEDLDTASLISQLDQAMFEQRKALMPFYSPLRWKLAKDSFDNALEQSKKGTAESEAEARKQLMIVQQCIEKMPESKALAIKELEDVAEYFKRLQTIEADKAYPEDYAELIEDLRGIAEKIDAPDLPGARSAKESLLEDMRDLEVKTITFQQTSIAVIALDAAEDLDADDVAEKSFERAENTIETATRVIEDNPRNHEQIKEASQKAFIEAKHASAVALEANTIVDRLNVEDLEPKDVEGLILHFETSLSNIFTSMGLGDRRYLTLSDQSRLLAESAERLRSGQPLDVPVPPHETRDYPPNTVEASKLWLPPEFQK